MKDEQEGFRRLRLRVLIRENAINFQIPCQIPECKSYPLLNRSFFP
jgi:hypothetical protein